MGVIACLTAEASLIHAETLDLPPVARCVKGSFRDSSALWWRMAGAAAAAAAGR